MAQKMITIIIFISVDIDNYHDKCQIFISLKFKARFLLLCCVSLFYCLCYFYFIIIIFIFALSIERTCPDLHFTTDYTLYDCVCDK